MLKWRLNRLVLSPPGYFFRAGKVTKSASETGWFLDFLSRSTSEVSVGRCLSFVSSSLNTVVSTDSRPLRDRQSGHFLETASLHPPLAALRRFPAPLPLAVQSFRYMRLTFGPMWGSAPTNNKRTPYSTSVGGDAYIAPPIGENASIF